VLVCHSCKRKIVFTAVGLLIFSSCVQIFNPPETTATYNYLVVDGFINAGNDTTFIRLSRTGPVTDTTQITPEINANLVIEGTDNSRVPLYENNPGIYACVPFNPSNNFQYRLHITTSNGSQYESDYMQPLFAPAIDSLGWINTELGGPAQSGVSIYVNTHNVNSSSRYYKWVYYETWEFHPPFESFYPSAYFLNNPGGPPLDYTALYTCWRTDTSTGIVLGSTFNLSENIISEIPIVFIPDSSWKLSVEYSILVQQQMLDENGYAFFQNLQQNSEELGSIFAPQPGVVSGNMHCLNNPSETVIGYVSCSSTTTKRIFIVNNQVTGWYKEPNSCQEWIADQDDYFLLDENKLILLQKSYILPNGDKGASVTDPVCGDCRLSGTSIVPSFWPN